MRGGREITMRALNQAVNHGVNHPGNIRAIRQPATGMSSLLDLREGLAL
jgi:hypothetical protein